MAMPKGKSGNPKGKPKGAVNKTTANAREAIARFVDGNAHRLEQWLDEIATNDPKDAFTCFQSVIEYHIPKLARQEQVGDAKNPIINQHELKESDRALLIKFMEQKGVKL